MSKQPPPVPTASVVGSWPTIIQISRTPSIGSLPSTIAPPDHPRRDGSVLCVCCGAGGEEAGDLSYIKERVTNRLERRVYISKT